MNTTSIQPAPSVQDQATAAHLPQGAVGLEPFIRAQGIQWRGGVDGRPLLLELTFENPHAAPTAPTPAVLRVADFGAFRAWTPLRTLEVPPLPARGRMTLTLDLDSEQRPALADLRADLPRRSESPLGYGDLLWAMQDLGDRDRASIRRKRMLRRLLRLRRQSLPRSGIMIPQFEKELSAGTPLHFVGNFDLKVGHQQPVERHFGDLANLQPNHANVTTFKIGDGTLDTYTFRVAECEPGWSVELQHGDRHDLHKGASVETDWAPVRVIITPPGDAVTGSVAVAVHRVRAGKDALVEFRLATARPG